MLCGILLSAPVIAEKEVVDSAFGFIFGEKYDEERLRSIMTDDPPHPAFPVCYHRDVRKWKTIMFHPIDCPMNQAPKPYHLFKDKTIRLYLNESEELVKVEPMEVEFTTFERCVVEAEVIRKAIESNRGITFKRHDWKPPWSKIEWEWESGKIGTPSWRWIFLACSKHETWQTAKLALYYANYGAYAGDAGDTSGL